MSGTFKTDRAPDQPDQVPSAADPHYQSLNDHAISHSKKGLFSGMFGHGFIAHLLGLDHEEHHDLARPGAHSHSRTPIWMSVLSSIRLSSLFDGIRFSYNFWFLIAFLGFTSWIFVVGWIRHHEPFATQVLGPVPADSMSAYQDRSLMKAIRKTMPVRTSPHMGDFYVPIVDDARNGDNAPAPYAVQSPILNQSFGVPRQEVSSADNKFISSSSNASVMAAAAGEHPFKMPVMPMVNANRGLYPTVASGQFWQPESRRLKVVTNH